MNFNSLWNRLSDLTELSFSASSASTSGWNGNGFGSVEVSNQGSGVLVFHETGTWEPTSGTQLSFSNIYRWTIQQDGETIRLEHLRLGFDNPVFLFDLKSTGTDVWNSADPHV